MFTLLFLPQKGFMKAILPSKSLDEAPQRSVKIKIDVIFILLGCLGQEEDFYKCLEKSNHFRSNYYFVSLQYW